MNFIIVGIGGFIGAALRYGIDIMPICRNALPLKILFINVLGSFVLGLLYAYAEHKQLPVQFVLFLGVGVCGGFTSFSTFAVQTVKFLSTNLLQAFFYVAASLLLSLSAIFIATKIVK